MRLFNTIKSVINDRNVAIVDFCTRADKEYIRAFPTKSTKYLESFMSRECLLKVQRRIFSEENIYFAADKFRETKWRILSNIDNIITLEKDVIYNSISIGRNLKVSIADDYKEIWKISDSNKAFKIVDIERGDMLC